MWREQMQRVAKKELTLFFSSPIAYLFLASFLAITLFVFFWVEAFFARNVADVRPMFEWMPILLIFLSAALTMRMWAEERRTGTMEFVVTLPVTPWAFVAGKFLACWALLGIALALTLPLPVTVSLIANLDWGPVWAAYIAAMLLGAAYLSIGLFVSARTDNQIVALILTVLVCGVFYLLGANVLTDLVGNRAADGLRALGSGSRFTSITRGVLDLRDLYYYASIVGVFLVLNAYTLERQRWAPGGARAHHRRWQLLSGLLALNLLAANLWLAPISWLRADMTEGNIFSISEATRTYLSQLKEPLLIRGYFSAKTHPLLAPLVPQMRDLINEYEVAGAGRVRVELVDPMEEPELEDEANSKYGIRPVPFQVSDKYQASLVNSYFDVLVQYGDEYEVLGFRDLIEVKVESESSLDVQLRNPEYDITRAIKKVLYGFQGGGNLFDAIQGEVRFVGYFSPDEQLPASLAEFKSTVNDVLDTLRSESGNRLSVEIVDPAAGDGELARQIAVDYGLRPMMASLFDVDTFYFYMTLAHDDDVVLVPLPDPLDENALKRGLESALKRFATGFLKTVALVAPQPNPMMAQAGMMGNQFGQLREFLTTNYDLESVDLSSGHIPSSVDVLMVIDPSNLGERELFAIDQFLMRGGTVMLATSPFETQFSNEMLMASDHSSGLDAWLEHHGIRMEKAFVMDPRNAAFPVPVTRRVGTFSFQEIRMLDYPYFVDVREDGMNQDVPVTADLPQLTVAWASPLEIDQESNAGRKVTTLLHSSPASWVSTSLDVMPRVSQGAQSPFLPGEERKSSLLGAVVEGRFDSYFAGKESPLLASDESGQEDTEAEKEADAEGAGVISGVIERSPESARLIVFPSNEFLADQNLRLIGSAEGTVYVNPLQLMSNAVDWSLEDSGLLAIRSRGHFNRTLPPMAEGDQMVWEYLNYALALAGVLLLFGWHRYLANRSQARYRSWLMSAEGA
jgi:ABC-2 type transport system permease protein